MASELKLIKQDHNDQERREWVQRKRAEQSTTSTAVVLARCQCQCVCAKGKNGSNLKLKASRERGSLCPVSRQKNQKKTPHKNIKTQMVRKPAIRRSGESKLCSCFCAQVLYFYFIFLLYFV